MTDSYEDIIHLPHHVSDKRPQMSAIDRAAQFSPFAALTGYDAAVQETARLTDSRIELDEEAMAALSDRLQIISDHLSEQPQIKVTYFKPDEKKAGGSYITKAGAVNKIDEYERALKLCDGTVIPIEDIYQIEGEIFSFLENGI